MRKKNKFGFKKSIRCSHAIYTIRKLVDHHVARWQHCEPLCHRFVENFDKINHHALCPDKMPPGKMPPKKKSFCSLL